VFVIMMEIRKSLRCRFRNFFSRLFYKCFVNKGGIPKEGLISNSGTLSHDDGMNGIQGKEDCEHSYRLYNNLEGEWKLIWECVHCGYLCMCKCFQKAMNGRSKASSALDFPLEHDIRALSDSKGIPLQEMKNIISRIPYKGMSCEICLDKPSTHYYSRDMRKSEFYRRYGAYIMKQAIEMVSNGKKLPDQSSYLREAEETVRMMYGFRPSKETVVDPTLLPSLVESAFPNENVLHNHSLSWLPDDCLEVFLPEHNLAIEYRDHTHYELLPMDESIERLHAVQLRDAEKEKACKENGVALIVFPYFKELDRDSLLWKVAEFRPALRE